MWSTFAEVAERYLESPPGGLEDLHEGAELWVFNTDFSLEFPQPLLPFTVLVGGLLNHPAKPPEQVCDHNTHMHWWNSVSPPVSLNFPNFTDPSGSGVVDFQFWGCWFYYCDSGVNGVIHLCGPSANRAGGWILQNPTGCTLEVKWTHRYQISIFKLNFIRLQCFAYRYDPERWPSHLDRPANLRLVDWLPLNNLLGNNSLLLLM